MLVGLLALPIGAVMCIIGLLIGFFEYPARHV